MTQNGFDFSDQLIKETFVSEAMAYSKPAKALGMKTVWINQGFGVLQKPLSKSEEPDYTINNLTELIKIFFLEKRLCSVLSY